MSESAKPLAGLLVVALEQAVAAPFCTSRLADAGARVIKVERHEGDFAREYDHVAKGESAYFVWLNRGKESICLDIKDEQDKDLLLNIIAEADIFIQNLAPNAAARLGLGSDVLRQQQPTLITVDISGYGETGPYSDMKAYDLLLQCETGLASITGSPEAPGRVGVSLCDIACGMYAHSAVLEALYERTHTGLGKSIKVSLFDSLADWMTVPLLHHDYSGTAPKRVGLNHPTIAPYGAYACQDHAQVVFSIQNEREWQRFCVDVLNQPALLNDPLFNSNTLRCENRAALDKHINSCLSELTREQSCERMSKAKLAFGRVNSVAQFSQHSQLRRMSVETPSGPVAVICPPAVTGEQANYGPVPSKGEHSAAIRKQYQT